MRCLSFTLIVVACLAAPSYGGEISEPGIFSDAMRSLSEEDARAFDASQKARDVVGDYGLALDLIEPVAAKPGLHWALYLYSAEVYEAIRDYRRAASSYRAALSAAGYAWQSLPVNLPRRIGHDLFLAGNAAEALPLLSEATKFPTALDNPFIYEDIAACLEFLGRRAEAADVFAFLIVLNPFEDRYREGLARSYEYGIPITIWGADYERRTFPREFYELLGSVHKIDPSDEQDIVTVANALSDAAVHLSLADMRGTASRYRGAAAAMYFHADRKLSDPTAVLSRIAKVRRSSAFAESGRELRAFAYLIESRAFLKARYILQATDALVRYCAATRRETREPVAELRDEINQAAIEYVSFDGAGIPRNSDPDAFIDPADIDGGVSGRHDRAPKNGVWQKYSSTSPSEEDANMWTVFILTGQPENERRLVVLLERLIAQRKLDVPVKFSLLNYGSLGLKAVGSSRTLGDLLDEEIEREGLPTIPQTTIEAYFAGKRLRERSFCEDDVSP